MAGRGMAQTGAEAHGSEGTGLAAKVSSAADATGLGWLGGRGATSLAGNALARWRMKRQALMGKQRTGAVSNGYVRQAWLG